MTSRPLSRVRLLKGRWIPVTTEHRTGPGGWKTGLDRPSWSDIRWAPDTETESQCSSGVESMFRQTVRVLVLLLLVAVPAAAQQAPADAVPAAADPAGGQAPAAEQVDELRRRLDVLAAEVERLRSGEVVAETE